MFVVRPIQDKIVQKAICDVLGAVYYENALAFYAADLKENGVDIDKYISICQFFMDKNGEIASLYAADGREEDEAVIVMLRAVMSFMNRCGISYAFFSKNAASEHWLKKSGFCNNNGKYEIDLDKFYNSPCKYSEDK